MVVILELGEDTALAPAVPLVCNNTDCDTPHPGRLGDVCVTCDGDGRLVRGTPIPPAPLSTPEAIEAFLNHSKEQA